MAICSLKQFNADAVYFPAYVSKYNIISISCMKWYKLLTHIKWVRWLGGVGWGFDVAAREVREGEKGGIFG